MGTPRNFWWLGGRGGVPLGSPNPDPISYPFSDPYKFSVFQTKIVKIVKIVSRKREP